MAKAPRRAPSGTYASQRMMLRAVERQAVGIRKVLISRRGLWTPGLTEDAESLARNIERIARYGQRVSASDAALLAELVEILLDNLKVKMRSLLAS